MEGWIVRNILDQYYNKYDKIGIESDRNQIINVK